jgi:coenzyme F420-dependent glucose-6-phosphate dehydrogenase
MELGFHFSHEQFSPRKLLELVPLVEKAGFKYALCSDHFHPWSVKQGHSGFAWSWLGAALQKSERLTFGTVNAPGQRYHPAIIAQAAATLAEMFPERFWFAAGSGQLLNEGITGYPWPVKEVRNERLLESTEIIRALWRGETVTHYGYITVEKARVYSLPSVTPLLFGAALTPETAEWVGSWADGLLTASQPVSKLKEIIDAFRNGGGENKPAWLKIQLSYHEDEEKAFSSAWDQWRNNVISTSVQAELRTPEQYDETSEAVSQDFFRRQVIISNNSDEFISKLKEYEELGFKRMYLHNVNIYQEEFITFAGSEILPSLRNK